jgi:Fe-S-cluster containining protein
MTNDPGWWRWKPSDINQMIGPVDENAATTPVTVSFKIFEDSIIQDLELPRGPCRPSDLLPAIRLLEKTIVARSVRRAEAHGKKVSCRAGCGACCCQLVPIAKTEAYALKALVDGMTEPRRTELQRRFMAAHQKVAATEIGQELRHPERLSRQEYEAVALAYFALGIKCPFLEEESCSIYRDRPLICREYLVTSPAEACRAPTREGVDRVEMPGALWKQLASIERTDPSTPEPWLVMTLALDWAQAHTEAFTRRTGPELMSAFLARHPELPGAKKKRPADRTRGKKGRWH